MNISIKAPNYVAQWAKAHFGDPVVLVKGGPESNLLKMLLEKPPMDDQKLTTNDDNLEIAIPWYKSKDSRVYNYLNKKSKQALASLFNSMFELALVRDLLTIENVQCSNKLILEGWMLKNGIDIDLDETLQKKFYRLRKKYHAKEINI